MLSLQEGDRIDFQLHTHVGINPTVTALTGRSLCEIELVTEEKK